MGLSILSIFNSPKCHVLFNTKAHSEDRFLPFWVSVCCKCMRAALAQPLCTHFSFPQLCHSLPCGPASQVSLVAFEALANNFEFATTFSLSPNLLKIQIEFFVCLFCGVSSRKKNEMIQNYTAIFQEMEYTCLTVFRDEFCLFKVHMLETQGGS